MTAEPQRAGAGGHRPRVLIVEDDPVHQSVMKDALAPLDVDAHFVATAEDALQHSIEKMPDLVLADFVLPGRSGLDLLLELGIVRGEQPKRVLMTARSSLPTGWGQDIPVLFKPFRTNALQWLVRELLSPDAETDSGGRPSDEPCS